MYRDLVHRGSIFAVNQKNLFVPWRSNGHGDQGNKKGLTKKKNWHENDKEVFDGLPPGREEVS